MKNFLMCFCCSKKREYYLMRLLEKRYCPMKSSYNAKGERYLMRLGIGRYNYGQVSLIILKFNQKQEPSNNISILYSVFSACLRYSLLEQLS